MRNIYTSAEQLIGNTPLLELCQIEKKHALSARLFAKLEYLNPSVKPAIFRGAKLPAEEVAIAQGILVDEDGYILPYGEGVTRSVEVPKNYLDAIPTGELTLYQIKGVEFPQNPGW